MQRHEIHRPAAPSPRLALAIACRLARAVVAGDHSSADAYRAILKKKGYAAFVIFPDGIGDAVKGWTETAARSRIAGLKPVMVVPLPTQADPLIFEPASNLLGDPVGPTATHPEVNDPVRTTQEASA